MPRLFSVSALLTRIRQETDTENDDHITYGFLVSHVSTVYGQLHGTVCETGLRYFESRSTLVTAGPTPNILAEPADQRSWVSLDWLVNGTVTGRRLPVDEIMAQERNRALSSAAGQRARYFELVGREYLLYPTPPIGQSYELRYIPMSADISTLAEGSAGSTNLDVVTEDGEAFLTLAVGVFVKKRKDQDPRFDITERDAALQRLSEWAAQRAFHQPRRQIMDPERSSGPGPEDYWYSR